VAYAHYDRLTALDAMFVDFEQSNVHMHVAAIALFEAAPLTTSDGTLDLARIRAAIEAALCDSPRFRQKLAWVPLLNHPVWIDDPHFNLSYHVRHTALPRPGSERLLKRMAGQLLSQKLDRGKPLWEIWIVEGVEGDRFALIAKAHHCMVDGLSGLDLLARMLRLEPDPTTPPPNRWLPRPAPSGARLLADELWRRSSYPLALMRDTTGSLTRPAEWVARLRERALSLEELVASGMRPTSPTPLNPEIGPYRRFDWTRTDGAAAREVRKHFGGTLNDMVLATAAGAIGRFLSLRGIPLDDLVFRAQVPVSTRAADDDGAGNRVVMLLADLPIAETDPVTRLKEVSATMTRLKRSRQRAGVEFLEDLSDHTLPSLWIDFARLATRQRSYNVVITNIPGPPRPVYLLGARMLHIYPLVPLAANQAVGIALFSYQGDLDWGFHADWDAVPDLHDLVSAVDEEFERLHKLTAEPAA
jgi:WS/DGAT/MGAT family acyltransferase